MDRGGRVDRVDARAALQERADQTLLQADPRVDRRPEAPQVDPQAAQGRAEQVDRRARARLERAAGAVEPRMILSATSNPCSERRWVMHAGAGKVTC